MMTQVKKEKDSSRIHGLFAPSPWLLDLDFTRQHACFRSQCINKI